MKFIFSLLFLLTASLVFCQSNGGKKMGSIKEKDLEGNYSIIEKENGEFLFSTFTYLNPSSVVSQKLDIRLFNAQGDLVSNQEYSSKSDQFKGMFFIGYCERGNNLYLITGSNADKTQKARVNIIQILAPNDFKQIESIEVDYSVTDYVGPAINIINSPDNNYSALVQNAGKHAILLGKNMEVIYSHAIISNNEIYTQLGPHKINNKGHLCLMMLLDLNTLKKRGPSSYVPAVLSLSITGKTVIHPLEGIEKGAVFEPTWVELAINDADMASMYMIVKNTESDNQKNIFIRWNVENEEDVHLSLHNKAEMPKEKGFHYNPYGKVMSVFEQVSEDQFLITYETVKGSAMGPYQQHMAMLSITGDVTDSKPFLGEYGFNTPGTVAPRVHTIKGQKYLFAYCDERGVKILTKDFPGVKVPELSRDFRHLLVFKVNNDGGIEFNKSFLINRYGGYYVEANQLILTGFEKGIKTFYRMDL